MLQKNLGRRALFFLTTILLLSGCAGKDDVTPLDVKKQAFEDLREQIEEVVADPARKAEAIQLTVALEKQIGGLHDSIEERKRRVRELNANYDTPRADFEAYRDMVLEEIAENRRSVSKTYQRFLETVTPEEREAIDKAHTKAIDAAIALLNLT
jgi:hypothetical protein